MVLVFPSWGEITQAVVGPSGLSGNAQRFPQQSDGGYRYIYRFLSIGLSYKLPVPISYKVPVTASYKVPVDN